MVIDDVTPSVMTTSESPLCTYQYELVERADRPDAVALPREPPPSCPHPTVDSEAERCLFHSTEYAFPPEAVADALVDALEMPDRAPVFAGGAVDDLDLSDWVLDTSSGVPIDLRGITIDGDLDLSGAIVEVPLLLGEAAVTGSVDATGARFRAAVDLTRTSIGGSLSLHEATVEAGLAGAGLEAEALDGRALTVEGPAVFEEASVSGAVRLGRASVEGKLSFTEADCGRQLDCTGLHVAGDAWFTQTDVGECATFTAATVDGELFLPETEVGGGLALDNAVVRGRLFAEGATIGGDIEATGLRCHELIVSFDKATIGGAVDFTRVRCSDGGVSLLDVTIGDETRVVDARIAGTVHLSFTRHRGPVQVRDSTIRQNIHAEEATFESEVSIRNSTIGGDVLLMDSRLEHVHLGATVAGAVEFEGVRVAGRLLLDSEIGGWAVFDGATFEGPVEVGGSRFLGPVSLLDTTFEVEPVLTGARFADAPPFDAATYPPDSSRDDRDRRRDIVVADADELPQQGLLVPAGAVTGNPTIPASVSGLTEVDSDQAYALTRALAALDGAAWNTLLEGTVGRSRGAAAALEHDDRAMLVYGIGIAPEAAPENPEGRLETIRLVGAYQPPGESKCYRFSHLDPDLDDIDVLVAVPADDSAFDAGASVGDLQEFRKAIHRRQALQVALLERDGTAVPDDVLPVLVGVGHTDT
jgi:hypothetical protein